VNRRRGFTLLELMITIVVTLFSLMGILGLHLTLTRGNDSASRSAEAVAVGMKEIESLRKQRSTDMMNTLTGSSATLPPVVKTNFFTALGRNAVSYQVDVNVTTVGTSGNLWLIRVLVSWTDDGSTAIHSVPVELIRTVQEVL
jgi:prepilin-type N-terminal cleavage/methylation domain-containing protein